MLESGKITVEIRSLNGKTADISIKTSLLPKDKEIAVRHKIANALQRGNIDFFMTYEPNAAENAKQINMEMAVGYYGQIMALAEQIGSAGRLNDNAAELISTLLKMPDVIDCKKQDVITDINWSQVEGLHRQSARQYQRIQGTGG